MRNDECGFLLPCPKGCPAKAAFAALQMLAGPPARLRFAPCSHRWYRWFNEAPVLMLVAVVVLVVVKPF